MFPCRQRRPDGQPQVLRQGPRRVRLGCGGRDAEEVMEHEWFGDMDWHALAVGKLPTPFVPRLQSPTDDSYFGPRERRGTPLKLSRREDCFSC